MSIRDATHAVAIVLGSYPSVNPDRIETFQKQAVQALKDYDPRILERMASPRGIVAQCKFVPSIAEMVEFCEKLANKAWEEDRRERARETQLTYRPEARETERERVIRGFQDLLRELDQNLNPLRPDHKRVLSDAERKAHAEAWLEAQAERAKTEPPPKLSDAALATMGIARGTESR